MTFVLTTVAAVYLIFGLMLGVLGIVAAHRNGRTFRTSVPALILVTMLLWPVVYAVALNRRRNAA